MENHHRVIVGAIYNCPWTGMVTGAMIQSWARRAELNQPMLEEDLRVMYALMTYYKQHFPEVYSKYRDSEECLKHLPENFR